LNSTSNDDLAQPFFIADDLEIDEKTLVVELAGEVDLYSAPELKKRILNAIEAGKTQIVVDLTKTTFIDSTTLGVLVGARKRLRVRDGKIAVVCPDPDKLALFEMTGLDRIFSIHDERQPALDAVRS
jgi:anti-sigma B factor antagonist